MASSGPTDSPTKKPRKPYTITKQRESWTDEEHQKFVEALQIYDRDWKKIEQFIGSKTVIQIRSHAQKYFLKIQKHNTGERIPPPRPKRKSSGSQSPPQSPAAAASAQRSAVASSIDLPPVTFEPVDQHRPPLLHAPPSLVLSDFRSQPPSALGSGGAQRPMSLFRSWAPVQCPLPTAGWARPPATDRRCGRRAAVDLHLLSEAPSLLPTPQPLRQSQSATFYMPHAHSHSSTAASLQFAEPPPPPPPQQPQSSPVDAPDMPKLYLLLRSIFEPYPPADVANRVSELTPVNRDMLNVLIDNMNSNLNSRRFSSALQTAETLSSESHTHEELASSLPPLSLAADESRLSSRPWEEPTSADPRHGHSLPSLPLLSPDPFLRSSSTEPLDGTRAQW